MEKRELVNYCYPLLILGLGISLSLAALPRVRAAFNHLPVDAAISELNKHRYLNNEKINVLIATAQQSIALDDQPRYWADLSQLSFFQAEKATTSKLNRQALLQQTQSSIEQSLVRSPANSWLWFQLARVNFLLNAAPAKTVKALNLSIMTGPYELGHLLPRLQLCLWLLPEFDLNDRFLLSSQVLIAWQKDPQLFIKRIALKNNNMPKIRLLLDHKYPDVLAAMETEIEKAH